MIKNWKLFLENSSEDDEMINIGNELRRSLKKLFQPMFLSESLVREFNLHEVLKSLVDNIYESLLSGFDDAIDSRFSDREMGEIIKSYFKKSLDRGKIVMMEKSLEEGVDFMIDEFVRLMIELRKSLEREGEEWKEEKERDYSELSQKEIQKLIDDALDLRDFKKVEFLSKYLKESVSTDLKERLEKITAEAIELIVQFVEKYFSKFQL